MASPIHPPADPPAGLPVFRRLDELTGLLGGEPLYLRFSAGPSVDRHERSTDLRSGAALPGLSVNPLDPPDWWGGRSPMEWVARQIDTYAHLAEAEDRVMAWVLRGEECGRGPDNEPLVRGVRPVARLDDGLVAEARRLADRHGRGRGGRVDAARPPWQDR